MTDIHITNDITPQQIEHEIEVAWKEGRLTAALNHIMVLNHKGDTQDCPGCWPEKTTE